MSKRKRNRGADNFDSIGQFGKTTEDFDKELEEQGELFDELVEKTRREYERSRGQRPETIKNPVRRGETRGLFGPWKKNKDGA